MNHMLSNMTIAPAPAARTVRTPPRPRPQPVSKSSRNPLAMSRTATSKTTGHAPSARMLDRMHEAAADLAALATASAGWRFAGDRNGTQLFEMAGRNLPPSVSTVRKFGRGAGHSSDFYLVRADVRVRADVGSMLDLLHSSTTDEFRLVARQIFQHHFHNGVTIDKLTCSTPPPFAPEPDDAGSANMARRSFSQDDAYSVNWLSLLDGDSRRDFTLVSYQDAFLRSPDESNTALTRVGRGYTTDVAAQPANPNLVAVHVLSSVNFQDIPELPLPESTDRLHLRNSGFVIEPTADPSVLRMSLLLSLLPTKSTLRNAKRYQRWLQTLASCVGNLAQTVRPQVSVQCLDKRSWKASDHCFMCLKMFRTFRRCHHCRFCGEAVCGACSSMVNMAGYAISDEGSASLGASVASSALSSRRLSASAEGASPDIWHLDANMVASRPSSSRGVKETRGCSACIADLQQNLAMSASTAMSTAMSRRSTASSFSGGRAAAQRSVASLSTEEDDVVSYNSADELDAGRLGALAPYQTSERMRRPQPAAEMKEEPMDEFPLKAEELQDKFPAVDEPAPPRFRNVSDPDQLRRMRNGSDPELVLRLKDKQSMISMSTASSSFSRTSSHDQLDSASQYSRGTNFSAMSDASSAGDLSRDPDILALAGLTLKPSSTAEDDPSDCSKQMKEQVPEEPEKEAEAEARALQTQVQKVEKVQEEEADVFKEEATPSAWPGSSRSNASYVSASSPGAEFRHRSNTASLRPERRMLHPADVLRHRSQTTASMAWNTAASASLSSAASASASTPSESSSNSSSSEVVKPAKTMTRPATGGTFHFSMMNSQPSSATTAIVAAVAAVGTPLQAPTASTSTSMPKPATPEPVETVAPTPQLTTYMGSSKIYLSTAARRGSAPKQMQMMTRLPATISEGSVSGAAERNDMIMLPPKQPTAAEFVLFSDSERESIFTRPDDGNDMIPLDF